jgi:hypothetical protein
MTNIIYPIIALGIGTISLISLFIIFTKNTKHEK